MNPTTALDRPPDERREEPGAESPDTTAEIERRAVRLLATREHGRAELQRKLVARGCSGEDVEPVLDDLERRGLLSERRYVESYIAGRRRKGYGPLRIQAELRERGVEPGDFADELAPDAEQWWTSMVEAAERRFGTGPAGDRREQGRRARFLEQRGFSPEMIRRLLWDV